MKTTDDKAVFPDKFTLSLADGTFVSSPANTTTSNPRLAGVFEAAYPPNLKHLETIHGTLTVNPWKPSGILRK